MRVLSNSISKFGLLLLFCLAPTLASADSAKYLAYGNQLLRQNRFDQANQYFSAVAKAEPRNPEAYKGMGYVAMGKNQSSQAVKYLEYALALNPSDQGLRRYLGALYQKYGNQYFARGDKAAALSWWKKAVAVDPSNTALAGYVASLQGAAQAQAAPVAPAPMAAAPATASSAKPGATPGFNPWIMGGTVAVLGAVMLFIF